MHIYLCRYNDISPLENHHCSIAFRLLEYPECNLLENITKDMYRYACVTSLHVYFYNKSLTLFFCCFCCREIREGIIRCILATDMARHNEILTQFREIISIFDFNNASHKNLVSFSKYLKNLTLIISMKISMNSHNYLHIGDCMNNANKISLSIYHFFSPFFCLQLCMVLIKVADISNEARPLNVAEPWLDRLLQEFFAQSAAEKIEGLPVTPFMVRLSLSQFY